MKYSIAIPSYRRAPCLDQTTLLLLQCAQIPPERIHIFVNDEKEKQTYEATLKRHLYGDIIVTGVKGIGRTRNFIQTYFPENEFVVMIDDDIYGLYKRVGENKTEDYFDIDKLIRFGFQQCVKIGTRMWGVYPIDNPYFMKTTVSTDLKFICANFMGLINSHDPTTFVKLDNKEDFERSIIYYLKYGGVVRINFIGVKSRYYKEPGGLQVDGRLDKEKEGGEYLLKTYPEFTEFNDVRSKTGDRYEIRLIDKRGKR